MDEERDLTALREFRSALDEPPEGVLVKGRYRLASSEYRPPRRRRQWLLTGAGAAAAVAVVVGAVAVAGGGAGGGDGGGEQAATKPAVAPVTDKADKDLPVTPGTRAPAGAAIVNEAGATHAKAVAAMDRLASAAAGASPLEIGEGKVLYIKSYNLAFGPNANIHEVWMDPKAMVPLRIRSTDGGATNTDVVSAQEEIDAAATQPANMHRPTTQYVASLPADPAQLLGAWRQWAQAVYPGRGADGMIWKDAYELLHYSEPFWTPAQRAAIYKALAKMPDVKGAGMQIDGKAYDLVCMFRADAGPSGNPDCVLFDSVTGRFAGNVTLGEGLAPGENVTLVDYGTQPRPIPGVKPSLAPSGKAKK
ncbi:hypothetical protein [Dactylosporangium darangshiense]